MQKDIFLFRAPSGVLASTLLLLLSSGVASTALAWGERGHDLVTRAAVQNMRYLADDNLSATRPFVLRDHMLSHLSNTPDIVWRADYMTEETLSLNGPTHYINLEKVYTQTLASLDDIDRDYAKFTARAKRQGFEDPSAVGTAPWRAIELYRLMVESLAEAKAASTDSARVDAVNQALLRAGIMSHFVADLTNPHHTSHNHDGQLTGNRGLHAYFESDVVAALNFGLAEKVVKKAQQSLALLVKSYDRERRNEILNDPVQLVFALVINSHLDLPILMQLDDKYSIVEHSPIESVEQSEIPEGERVYQAAVRKPPADTAHKYERFAVKRLAIGAATLSQLWYLAWQEAGRPDMSSFHSYYYPVQPTFIKPNYLLD